MPSQPVEKKVPTSAFVSLILGLLVIGATLLYASGAFDSPEIQTPINEKKNLGNNSDVSSFHNGSDLKKLNEIRELESIVAENPNDYASLLKLAHSLNDAGFYQKAIVEYERYLKFRSNDADVWIDLGTCYYQAGDAQSAVRSMKKGLEIQPNHQIANFNLGIVNLSLNQKELANKYFQKAIEINPNNDIAERAKSLLNKK